MTDIHARVGWEQHIEVADRLGAADGARIAGFLREREPAKQDDSRVNATTHGKATGNLPVALLRS